MDKQTTMSEEKQKELGLLLDKLFGKDLEVGYYHNGYSFENGVQKLSMTKNQLINWIEEYKNEALASIQEAIRREIILELNKSIKANSDSVKVILEVNKIISRVGNKFIKA